MLEGSQNEKMTEAYRGQLMDNSEIELLCHSYRRLYGKASKLKGGLSYDDLLAFLSAAYILQLLKPIHTKHDATDDLIGPLTAAFDIAIDMFLYIDKGDGVIILSELADSGRLDKLGISDFLTLDKLRELDPGKTDYVCFTTFLPAFLHWIDGDLDDV